MLLYVHCVSCLPKYNVAGLGWERGTYRSWRFSFARASPEPPLAAKFSRVDRKYPCYGPSYRVVACRTSNYLLLLHETVRLNLRRLARRLSWRSMQRATMKLRPSQVTASRKYDKVQVPSESPKRTRRSRPCCASYHHTEVFKLDFFRRRCETSGKDHIFKFMTASPPG
jgi:hypothetical protein